MSVTCGPFELEERVGEGTGGEVWRAHHLDQQATVAIKLLTGLAEADAPRHRRFRKEVRAHAALEHPGTIRIFDYGQTTPRVAEQTDGRISAGVPYIVTEFADGGTLAETPPKPDWPHLQNVLHNLLSALAYAHARGVVHLGLKPSNILWFEEETGGKWRPKLGDSGLDHLTRHDTNQQSHELVVPEHGTPAYMAPEQFLEGHQGLGPETDLYQLGLVAWQWVCGRTPYGGDDPGEIARAHLERSLPAFDPVFGVPDELEGWLKRLLAREPARRFQRAADAAYTLANLAVEEVHPDGGGLGADSTAGLPVSVERPDQPVVAQRPGGVTTEPSTSQKDRRRPLPAGAMDFDPPPPFPDDWRTDYDPRAGKVLTGAGEGLFGMREIPFVGRESERQHVWETFRQVTDTGQPRVLLVEGPRGTGKSRLVEWMARRAHETGIAEVLKGVHSRQGGPEVGLRGMAEDFLRTAGLSRYRAVEEIFDRLQQTFAPDVDDRELQEASVALADLVSPIEPGEEASDSGPSSSLLERYLALGQLLERLTDQRPVIVWLDDLQWGASSLAWMVALAQRDLLPGAMFVGTLRAEDPPEAVAEDLATLEALLEDDQLDRLRLEAFEAETYGTLLEQILPLTPDLRRRVQQETQRDPVFGVQLVSDWVSRGLLDPVEEGYRLDESAKDPIPEAMDDLWRRRLAVVVESLEQSGYEQAERAIQLAAALGRRVLPAEWQKLGERTGVDCKRRIMERLVEFGLVDQKAGEWRFLHDSLLESIAASARRQGVWEADKQRCAELVSDLYPGRPDVSQRRRAEYLVDAGQIEAALEPLYEAVKLAVSIGGSRAMADLLARREELMDRMDLAEQSRPRIQNRIQQAEAAWRSADNREAQNLLREAIRICRRQSWHAELANALMVKGRLESTGGRPEKAIAAMREAEDKLRQLEEPVQLALTMGKRLRPLRQLGRYDRAFELLDEMRDLFEQEEVTLHLRAVDAAGANIQLARGNIDEAVEEYEKLLNWARREGSQKIEAKALHGLAEAARMRHNLDEARDYYRQVTPMFRELGSLVNMYISEIATGLVDLADGHVSRAETRAFRLERQLTLSGINQLLRQLKMLQAGVAAGNNDWDWWDDAVDPLVDAHNAGQLARIYETAWALELVGDLTLEADDLERAKRVYRLAQTIYGHLDQSDDSRRLIDKMVQRDGQSG